MYLCTGEYSSGQVCLLCTHATVHGYLTAINPDSDRGLVLAEMLMGDHVQLKETFKVYIIHKCSKNDLL